MKQPIFLDYLQIHRSNYKGTFKFVLKFNKQMFNSDPQRIMNQPYKNITGLWFDNVNLGHRVYFDGTKENAIIALHNLFEYISELYNHDYDQYSERENFYIPNSECIIGLIKEIQLMKFVKV